MKLNNKGFTLVELLAVIVILSVVAGITITSLGFDFRKSKQKSEEVFVGTIKDMIESYLSYNQSNLQYTDKCSNTMNKKHGNVDVYYTQITFNDILNSTVVSLSDADFYNSANEDTKCDKDAVINIYRDADFVYYYSVDKTELKCLENIKIASDGESEELVKKENTISTLPEEYVCG